MRTHRPASDTGLRERASGGVRKSFPVIVDAISAFGEAVSVARIFFLTTECVFA